MNRQDQTEMEEILETSARSFKYPATPDLASSSTRMVENTRSRLGPRLMVPAMLAILLFCSVSIFVAPVRAAVIEFIQVGVVQIFTGEPDRDLPEGMRSETIYSLLGPVDGGATLLEAETALGQKGTLKKITKETGPPDRVFVQDLGDTAAILLWFSGEGEEHVGMSLIVLRSGASIGKDAPATVTRTEIWGQDALWLTGDHSLYLMVAGEEMVIPVAGNILIWEYHGLTYRLETSASLDQALEMLETAPN